MAIEPLSISRNDLTQTISLAALRSREAGSSQTSVTSPIPANQSAEIQSRPPESSSAAGADLTATRTQQTSTAGLTLRSPEQAAPNTTTTVNDRLPALSFNTAQLNTQSVLALQEDRTPTESIATTPQSPLSLSANDAALREAERDAVRSSETVRQTERDALVADELQAELLADDLENSRSISDNSGFLSSDQPAPFETERRQTETAEPDAQQLRADADRQQTERAQVEQERREFSNAFADDLTATELTGDTNPATGTGPDSSQAASADRQQPALSSGSAAAADQRATGAPGPENLRSIEYLQATSFAAATTSDNPVVSQARLSSGDLRSSGDSPVVDNDRRPRSDQRQRPQAETAENQNRNS